jgi:hypothetical protein
MKLTHIIHHYELKLFTRNTNTRTIHLHMHGIRLQRNPKDTGRKMVRRERHGESIHGLNIILICGPNLIVPVVASDVKRLHTGMIRMEVVLSRPLNTMTILRIYMATQYLVRYAT